MKKQKTMSKTFFILFSFLLIALLSITIGYSALSTTLTINGVASFTPVDMIRVMSIRLDNFDNAMDNDNTFSYDFISMSAQLDELSSSISYVFNITNLGEVDKTLSKIENVVYSNNDIMYTIDGLSLNDTIKAKQSINATITFRYRDSVSEITNNTINSKIRFRFSDRIDNSFKIAYFMEYNGKNDLMGFTKTNIKEFKRNTSITLEEVLNKSGVKVVSTSESDVYPSETKVYAYVENNIFYWYSDADLVYFHPKTLRAFNNFSALTSVDLAGTSTSEVENFSHFFDNDRKLTEIKGIIDTSGLVLRYNDSFDYAKDTNNDSSSETGLTYMFNDCNALKTVDLSAIDTTNAADLKRMFGGCKALKNIDVSRFNTANAKSMYWMFRNCTSVSSLDLSSFDTTNVINMNGMFLSSTSLETVRFGKKFTTKNTVNTARMFENVTNLKTIYAYSDFEANSMVTSSNMFSGNTKLVGGRDSDYTYNFNSSYKTITMAKIPSESQNGYLTLAKDSDIVYTLTYNLDGGIATNPESYTPVTETFTLNNPTKEGYDFIGWTGSNGSTLETTITIHKGSTGNRTYTANYVRNTFTITYNLNGGTVSNPTSYSTTTPSFTLNNPTKPGYNFIGWTGSNGSELETNVTISTGTTGDLVYTANYELIEPQQTFTLAGPCTFNGKNGFVTGSGCEEYSGQSYVNTGISLYSEANHLRDFEISFTIDSFDPSNQDSGTSQPTFMNTKYELSSISYPGLTIRKESGKNNYEITQTIEGSKVSKTFAISVPFTFKIIRRNSIIYYSVNNGDEIKLQDISNFTHYFDTPVTFGSSLDSSGKPFRQAKVTISDMKVILY